MVRAIDLTTMHRMSSRLLALLIALLCVALPAVAADPNRGKMLWDANCAVCHGPTPDAQRKARGSTADALSLAINNIGSMRFLRPLLSQTDLEDLAAYIRGDPITPPPPTVVTPRYNVTDLWYIEAESGWGINLTQHSSGASPSNVVVALLYVYTLEGKPLWLIADNGKWTTPTEFTSNLYRVAGPSQASGTFNSAQVRSTLVGTITMLFTSDKTAEVTYSVSGQTVSKAVRRLEF
jgi:cytochrome c553